MTSLKALMLASFAALPLASMPAFAQTSSSVTEERVTTTTPVPAPVPATTMTRETTTTTVDPPAFNTTNPRSGAGADGGGK